MNDLFKLVVLIGGGYLLWEWFEVNYGTVAGSSSGNSSSINPPTSVIVNVPSINQATGQVTSNVVNVPISENMTPSQLSQLQQLISQSQVYGNLINSNVTFEALASNK